jgi:hypothetical protein
MQTRVHPEPIPTNASATRIVMILVAFAVLGTLLALCGASA